MAALDASNVPLFSGPQKIYYRFAIGVIVAILGVRYLPTNLIHQLALPSSALAAAITLLIPFVIFFVLVEKSFSSPTARRLAWIVYSVLLFALWSYNFNKPWAWIYFAMIAACGVMFFIDPVLVKFRNKMRSEENMAKIRDNERMSLLVRLEELQKQRNLLLANLGSAFEIETVNQSIRNIEAELKRLSSSSA